MKGLIIVIIAMTAWLIFKRKRSVKNVVLYMLKKRRPFLFFFCLILVTIVIDLYIESPVLKVNNPKDLRSGFWGGLLAHYITIGTFLAAFSAWFSSLFSDWRASLPKRLTVIFEHNDKKVMQCNYANLSGESDIRALAQQIGLQMASENLNFSAAKINWRELDIVYSKKTTARTM